MEMDMTWQDGMTREDVLQFSEGILQGEPNYLANLANLAAVLGQFFTRVNWVGFYIAEHKTGDMVLGPFVGLPACTRIGPNQGVVGHAATIGQTLIIDNVLEFPGHIACDAASRSEIVVPILVTGQVVAVIDVDSPELGRFGPDDQNLLESLAGKIAGHWHHMRSY